MSLPWRRSYVPFNPWLLPNTQAIYSLRGSESDSTYLTNGLGKLRLVADRSGNSAVNGLVTNGVSGNYASAPSSVPLNIGANFVLIADWLMFDWTPATQTHFLGKFHTTDNKRQYDFRLLTDGKISCVVSSDGGIANTTQLTSSESVGFLDFRRGAVRVDWVGATASATFYTAPTKAGPWTQLGTVPTGTARTPFSSDALLTIGSITAGTVEPAAGVCYGVQIIDGTFAAGTTVFDEDFTRVAKLAATCTESSANAATVTVNTSGDLGARICGARDRVQLTTAKMPTLSTAADGRKIVTGDGSNDYMGGALFPLSQPISGYHIIAPLDWTLNDSLMDGGSTNTLRMFQTGTTPRLDLYAGAQMVGVTSSVIGTRACFSLVFNGALSSARLNRDSASTGNAGTATPNGFTLFAYGDGSIPANMAWSESIIASRADIEALQLRIASSLMRTWGVN